MRTRRAVPMASRMLPPPPVDGLSRSSRDRPILGLAWRRASNQATTQASVHCICTAQATTHGRKTRPVAGEWCLGCVAAAAVPRRSVPSCPAVQLSHCPDSCLVRGPDCDRGRRCGVASAAARRGARVASGAHLVAPGARRRPPLAPAAGAPRIFFPACSARRAAADALDRAVRSSRPSTSARACTRSRETPRARRRGASPTSSWRRT